MAIRAEELDAAGEVWQVTDEPLAKSNIYCEIPYCSADSKRFVYRRENPERAPNSAEYVACEFGSWDTRVAGRGLHGPAMTREGVLYFRRHKEHDAQDFVRLDLAAHA